MDAAGSRTATTVAGCRGLPAVGAGVVALQAGRRPITRGREKYLKELAERRPLRRHGLAGSWCSDRGGRLPTVAPVLSSPRSGRHTGASPERPWPGHRGDTAQTPASSPRPCCTVAHGHGERRHRQPTGGWSRRRRRLCMRPGAIAGVRAVDGAGFGAAPGPCTSGRRPVGRPPFTDAQGTKPTKDPIPRLKTQTPPVHPARNPSPVSTEETADEQLTGAQSTEPRLTGMAAERAGIERDSDEARSPRVSVAVSCAPRCWKNHRNRRPPSGCAV